MTRRFIRERAVKELAQESGVQDAIALLAELEKMGLDQGTEIRYNRFSYSAKSPKRKGLSS